MATAGKLHAPGEINALMLRKVADDSGRLLGEPVTEMVITVPVFLNHAQRQTTKDAGRIAGLEMCPRPATRHRCQLPGRVRGGGRRSPHDGAPGPGRPRPTGSSRERDRCSGGPVVAGHWRSGSTCANGMPGSRRGNRRLSGTA
jgi:hypothetical protein